MITNVPGDFILSSPMHTSIGVDYVITLTDTGVWDLGSAPYQRLVNDPFVMLICLERNVDDPTDYGQVTPTCLIITESIVGWTHSVRLLVDEK